MYRELGSTGIVMYDLLAMCGFLSVLIFNFCAFKRKRIFLSNSSMFLMSFCSKKYKSAIFTNAGFWTFIEILFISIVQHYPLTFLNPILADLTETGTNYFGYVYFIPVFLFLFFYLIAINPFKQLDLIVPSMPLALIFIKLACFCEGCCGGFACEWGLLNYHPSDGPQKQFPTQLVEIGLALCIFIFLMIYRKKAKEGTLFPIFVILYSATRFFSEFTRNDPNVFGILKTYHILCIIGIILGVTELILILKFSEKIKPYFEHTVFPWCKPKQIVHHKKRKK